MPAGMLTTARILSRYTIFLHIPWLLLPLIWRVIKHLHHNLSTSSPTSCTPMLAITYLYYPSLPLHCTACPSLLYNISLQQASPPHCCLATAFSHLYLKAGHLGEEGGLQRGSCLPPPPAYHTTHRQEEKVPAATLLPACHLQLSCKRQHLLPATPPLPLRIPPACLLTRQQHTHRATCCFIPTTPGWAAASRYTALLHHLPAARSHTPTTPPPHLPARPATSSTCLPLGLSW